MIHDYVNRTKPTALNFFWKRYGGAVQFALLVLAMVIVGGVV